MIGPGGVFVIDSKQYRAASSSTGPGGCGTAATPSPPHYAQCRSRPTRPGSASTLPLDLNASRALATGNTNSRPHPLCVHAR